MEARGEPAANETEDQSETVSEPEDGPTMEDRGGEPKAREDTVRVQVRHVPILLDLKFPSSPGPSSTRKSV